MARFSIEEIEELCQDSTLFQGVTEVEGDEGDYSADSAFIHTADWITGDPIYNYQELEELIAAYEEAGEPYGIELTNYEEDPRIAYRESREEMIAEACDDDWRW